MTDAPIAKIDVSPLFGGPSRSRDACDGLIRKVAQSVGFMVLTGLPADAALSPGRRRELLRLFTLPESEIRKLWLWNFDHAQENVYRGWFPLQKGFPTYKEGMDIGADLVTGSVPDSDDPLLSATPFPSEDQLPGWRAAARDYYVAMTRFSAAVMRSIARGLDIEETTFDDAFIGGLSTLRLVRYPVRPDDSFGKSGSEDIWIEHQGERRYMTGRAHCDTGFLTVLAQDGVSGLQAKHHDGSWFDIPPEEGTVAINFGKVLERWTAGRVRATVHRVLGTDRERYSIPFFYEPRPDAVIAPLPLADAEAFEAFTYGDHLWDTITTHNIEFRGIRHLRQPRGLPKSASGNSLRTLPAP